MQSFPDLLALLVLFYGQTSSWSRPALDQAGLRGGAAQVEISPERLPVIVNAMFTERTADKVIDPLFAKALVLEDRRTRLAICVVDTCMAPRPLLDRAKEIAAQATGIPAAQMLISATHTHSAPAAMGCLGSRADTNYAAALPPKIAAAIIRAWRNLAPAQIGWAAVDDWDHTYNRRWIRRPDRMLTDPFGQQNVRAHMHPGHQNPDALGPSGPVDPGLTVLALRSREGRPLALLANYSQHYYESPLLSSDYYGRFALHLARLLAAEGGSPPFVGLMSQGTSGDLMWMDYGSPRRAIGYDAYGRELAERVAAAYQSISWRDAVTLRAAERHLSLRYRVPDENRLAWARRTVEALTNRLPQSLPEIYAGEALCLNERQQTELKLQVLQIGDLGITAIPNEVFAITGLKLKAQSPLQPTFNISLANGAEGYIPPPEQHALGGYTTCPARTAGLEVSAEPRIVEALLGLLEEVAGKPRRPVLETHGPYAEAIIAAKPHAYWRLEEMSFPAACDASGADRHAGYEEGVALYLPGAGSGTGHGPAPRLLPSRFSGPQINRAAHFAGGRLRARLPQLGSSYSLELWLWNALPADARAVTGYFFSRGSDQDHGARGEHLGIGGTLQPHQTGRIIFFNGSETNQVLTGRTPLQLRHWHHIVLVREGRQATVYLDGQPDLSGKLEFTLPPDEPLVFLGGRCDRFANFEGKLDEIAVYDRVLSPEEVFTHFQASAPR